VLANRSHSHQGFQLSDEFVSAIGHWRIVTSESASSRRGWQGLRSVHKNFAGAVVGLPLKRGRRQLDRFAFASFPSGMYVWTAPCVLVRGGYANSYRS
jgi:hypothetical protein